VHAESNHIIENAQAERTELQSIAAIPVTRYRYRGSKIPAP
jgi:hypothetical protein